MDELHEHLPVGLERGCHHVFVGAVVAASYGSELDPRHARSLEVDDIAGTVAPDAYRVSVEVSGGYLAEDLDVRVGARDVGRLAGEEDLHLCWQVYRADLADYLLRGLVGQVADIQVVGAAVGDAVYDIPADDARQVYARVGEELIPVFGEGQLDYPAVMIVGQEDRVLAEPGGRDVGALAPERDPEVEHALGLGADVEVCGLAGDQEVAYVAVLDEDLRPRRRPVLLLLVWHYEELYRGVAPSGIKVRDGVHHRRQGALHVVYAAPIELAVLLVGLELPLLAGHDVRVPVQQYARFPRAHPHHEGGQLTVWPRTPVADRLEAPRLEPAVDKVDGRAGDARGVRPEANQPPGQGDYLGSVCG